jgi:hypothetical protein
MTSKTLNKSRKAPSAHVGPGAEVQRQEWGRGSGVHRGYARCSMAGNAPRMRTPS